MKAKTIKLAVLMSPSGDWIAHGWSEDDFADACFSGVEWPESELMPARIYIVEVVVPVPEKPKAEKITGGVVGEIERKP